MIFYRYYEKDCNISVKSLHKYQTVVSFATGCDGPYVTGKESITNEIDKEEKMDIWMIE